MAPSSFKMLGAAFAFASAGQVAAESYTLTEKYTADNFFEKFDFYVSDSSTGETDPTHGFVNYRSQADAESLGLISSSNGQIYIGPDSNQTYSSTGNGRDSVRIMSKAKYNQGLMIAKFSHMPAQSCGSWPAFWSYGSPWLSSGEIDYYEGWNDLGHNVMALHTNLTIAGECLLTTTNVAAEVTTQDCNDEKVDESIGQYVGTGCGVSDTAGVWGSSTGATFAMQWADDAIKIWNWLPSNVPSDITAGTPDPDANSGAWGEPQLLVEQTNCDLASAFSNQQLVFNIDFCGDTAGNSVLWADTCSAMGSTCVDYVAANPSAFAETYFMIEGIEFYELGAASASASASASSAVATSEAATSATAAAETSSGVLSGIGSISESTLGVSATVGVSVAAAATTTYSHSTSYITGTSTTTNENGETTVVVVVDTTICPITAAEASESSVLATATTAVPAQTTATSETSAVATTTAASVPVVASTSVATTSTSTSTQLTTSTIFATHTSTISSCASAASGCSVGDVTTVVVAISTTICPVTAAEASQSANATISTSVATSQTAAVQASSSPVSSSPSGAVPQAAETSVQSVSSKAASKTAALATSVPLAAQSTVSKPTTISRVTKSAAVTKTVQATQTSETALIMATGATTEYSVTYGDVTETLAVASATYSYPSGNGTTMGVASSTSASAQTTCSGIDCIVVSNSGSKSTIGASGIALAAIAGVVFLF